MNRKPVAPTHLVYRPGDPQGRHDAVYVAWLGDKGLMEGLDEARAANRGQLTVEVDATYAPVDAYLSEQAVRIPTGTHNMTGVRLMCRPNTLNDSGTTRLITPDGCSLENLSHLEMHEGEIVNLNTTGSPVTLGGTGPYGARNTTLHVDGKVSIYSGHASAEPFFKLAADASLLCSSPEMFGLGDQGEATDMVDLNGFNLSTNATIYAFAGGGSLIGVGTSTQSVFVYRPFDSLGQNHDNVYVSWVDLMTALDATANQGPRKLYFDSTGSPDTDGIFDSGRAAITIPDGTWDMADVFWSSSPAGPSVVGEGCAVIFSDDCHIENLQKIDAECDLLLVNKSSTNIPIIIRPSRQFFYLGGHVKVANNSAAGSTPSNPTAKAVFGLESGGFASLQGFDKLTTLGLFTTEHGVTVPPMNPVFDINGGFLLTVALMWQENAFACTGGSGFVWVLGSEGSNDSGWGNIQSWKFTDPGMATTTLLVWTVRRTRWFLDSLQFFIQPVITPAEYANPGRSPLYQPQDPAVATEYACYHNQFVNCDSGPGQLDIRLPTAFNSAGDVVAVKDKTGNTTAGLPIVILAQPGETIDGAASVSITTAFGCKKFVSDSYGNWMIESSM